MKIKDLPKVERPKKIGTFVIPKWWECQWRRVPCGKKNCRLCGKMMDQRERHTARGENPDDPKLIAVDVAESLEEANELLDKKMRELGIDPATLEKTEFEDGVEYAIPFGKVREHPLQRRVHAWVDGIYAIFRAADQEESPWLATEAAADVEWYAPLLAGKIARQLATRADFDRGVTGNVIEADHQFTRYVLSECFSIIEVRLHELANYASNQKGEIVLALPTLLKLKLATLKL